MSLQVWLPLNGDFKNQGLAGELTCPNTLTFSNSGKIGEKCLNSYTGWFSIPTMDNKKQMSFAYWAKINEGTTTNWKDIFTWYTTDGTYIPQNRQEMYSYNSTTNTMTTGVWYANGNENKVSAISEVINQKIGEWIHYTFTIDYNTGQTQFFVNGKFINSLLNAGTSHYIKPGDSFRLRESDLNCSINDFRLYDHILSSKEIEEISKGLVLHYKLDNIINNIVYDCSGYNYNSKIIGTYSLNTISARYSKNLFMNNTNTANHIETLQDILYDKTYLTVSCWVKADKSKSQVIFVQPNIEFGFLNNLAYVNTISSAPFSLTNYKNNEWNYITVIKNNADYELYINGKKETRGGANNNYVHNGNKLYLLNRNYNNNYAGKASVSDFRIYITVLNEEQIKELYNTSATIDNNGNIYAREFIENDNLNITKAGLFQTSTIEDDNNGQASIFKTKKILGTNLYEY